MPRKSTSTKDARQRYSCEYKSEALALAAQVGVSEAQACDVAVVQLRAKAEASRERLEVEQTLAADNARLKRLLAEEEQEIALLKKASAYFAKHQS